MGQEKGAFSIMLVEDDEGFRRTLAGALMSSFPSIVVDEARDGSEAMGKLENFVPNLIFMDIKLPGQSGLVVTKRIKSLHPEVNVIILTSYDFPEYREAARASGAFGFLSKGSCTAQEIEDVVKGLWARGEPSCVPFTG